MLEYAELRGGRAAVERMLAHAGCTGREEELRDETTWFSLDTKLRLFKGLVAALEDPAAVRKAGEQALELSVADGLKIALRALGSPTLVYRNVVRANAKFSAIHSLELLELGRGRATMSFGDNTGGEVHPLDCDYTRGLLSVVPVLFGLAPAQIVHHQCAARGAARCVYHVSWTRSRVTPRAVLGTGALSAAALAGTALAAPALLPVAGLAGAAAGGVLAARAIGDLRARTRHLEQEVQWRDDVAVRLTESMQDLVSALDLDEVLDKVVGNARATVNSKEFALLVAEDGLLRCRASTGVPEDSLATLETWVAAEHPRASEPVLVEDVATVPGLASLSGHRAMPVGSVCLAPLTYRGSTVGHLLALAPQARTFLPRDLDLVTSYAAASAIALANARHFAEQRALATRDPLTGLLNHREFHESVERELHRARRHGGAVAIALFDLDGFKLVNDSDGHAEGDRVLRAVAGALGEACRASDRAFRVGGDEFALLLPETERGEAAVVANRVRRALGEVDPRVSASIGMASWPDDGGSKDVLLAHADAGLYAMKGAARQRRTAARRTAAAGEPDTPLLRERLAMANRLSAKLAPVLGPQAIAEVAVGELHRSFDELVAYVQRREGDRLQVLAVGGTVTEEHDVPLWSQGLDQGVSGRVARTGRPALVHDTTLDPDHVGAELVDPERGHEVVLRSQLAVPLRVDGRIWGVLSIQAADPGAYTSDDVLLLETVAAQVAAALHRAELVAELDGAFSTTLGVLSDALEAKDEYTASHAHDVADLAAGVGVRLGLGRDDVRQLRYAALLHDIGKIAVPTEILTKPGPLTAEERQVMERHTVVGAQMLERIPFFAGVHPLVRASHERWDGAGYPDRVAGEEIPLGARIIGACDAFHAMTSDRPYRSAMPLEDALAELRRCSGSQFDPLVVGALVAEASAAAMPA